MEQRLIDAISKSLRGAQKYRTMAELQDNKSWEVDHFICLYRQSLQAVIQWAEIAKLPTDEIASMVDKTYRREQRI